MDSFGRFRKIRKCYKFQGGTEFRTNRECREEQDMYVCVCFLVSSGEISA